MLRARIPGSLAGHLGFQTPGFLGNGEAGPPDPEPLREGGVGSPRGRPSQDILARMGPTLITDHLGAKRSERRRGEGTVPQLPGIGWGSSPRAAPPHAPPPHSCGRAGPLPRGEGGACAVRGKVTRGDAPPPPPFVPRVGGGAMLARGPFGRCTRPRVQMQPPPPAHRCRGSEGPEPRAHPPARGIRPGDRQRRRPCPAPGSVCKVSRGVEGSAHPPRADGEAEAASLGRGGGQVGAGRDDGTSPPAGQCVSPGASGPR